jgi:chromosome segregation ATPase
MVEEVRTPVLELDRAEIPWVVAYLREDIQDLRNEVRENRRSIERLRQDLDTKIEGLDAKIGGLRQDMDVKIGGLRQDMDVKIEGLDAKIEELRRETNLQFRWMLTTMVAVGAVIVAALKLLP